ncbi:hypothetical protein BZM27_52155, partial [Paraburkholderia steynii]
MRNLCGETKSRKEELFMLKKLVGILFAIAMLALVGCGQQKKAVELPTLLEDISGVWKTKGENSMLTLDYTDKKLRMLMDADFIPVTVGAMDNENQTVNLNVTLADGKPAVWTIRELWNADKS